ncbi:MAG TPA: hypothetical protein VFW23_11350, partial [Tepidisphaeraceae bacterium]|nr:hypothetical protein [Tepidisphaeraceae bacterium]
NGGNGGDGTPYAGGSFIITWCGGAARTSWGIDWGDGSSGSGSGDSDPTHTYGNPGQYLVTITDGDGNVVGGNWVNVNPNFHPTLSAVPDQIVSTGDAVDVSSTANEVYYNEIYEGYVDWGDGTGLHPTGFTNMGSSAKLTAHLDAAGDPGQHGGSLILCSSNEPYDHTGSEDSTGFNIDVSSFSLNVADLPDASQPSPNQMDPGAFIPINDNYDAGEDVPDDQLPVPDADDPQLVDASLTLSGASGAQATWSLNFPSSIDVFQVQDDGTLMPVTSGEASGPVTLEPDGTDVSIELEGISADANILLQATMTPVSGQVMAAPATDQAKGQTAEFGLNAYTQTVDANGNNVSGPELDLSNKDKVNAGVFVPVNNADEAYKVANGQLTLDKNVSGPIAGEDETLALVVHTGDLGTVPPGSFKLTIPSFLRVYQNADRSGLISTNSSIAVTHDGDMLLYVEGITGGTGTISLLVPGSNVPLFKLKVTAFNWTGALNVPQNAAYEYKVTNPTRNATNNPDGGKWLTPVHGTQTLHGINGQQGTNNSDVDIQWGTGPAVGEAIYEASPDFIWSLGVNIVKVTISNPTNGDPDFKGGVPFDGGVIGGPQAPQRQIKLVASGNPALQWNAQVTLAGPNNNHGVDLINVGFVQDLTITSFSGTYTGGFVRSARKIVGQTFWDTIDRTEAGETGNYSDKRYSTNRFATFDTASSAPGGTLTREISSLDTPESGPPLYYFPGERILTSVSLSWDFTIYLTATTKEKQNGSDGTYVSQAMAKWSFNGSGTIGAGAKWSGPGSLTAPSAWAAPDGSKPKITGIRANDVLHNYWTQTGF